MLRLRQTSISLSIVLLALSAKVFSGLTCPREPMLGLVLAVMGAAILASLEEPGLSPGSPLLIRPGRPASLLVAASVLAAGLISTPVLKLFAWRLHEVPLHNHFYYIVSHILPGVSRSGGALAFWTGRGLETVRLTFEGLGLYEIWYLAVGLTVFGALAGSRPGARAALRLAAVIALYALMRLLVVTVLAIELDRADIMWRPVYSVLSWLPLAGMLRLPAMLPGLCGRIRGDCKLKPGRTTGSAPQSMLGRARERTSGRASGKAPEMILALSCVLAAGVLIAFIIAYEDPGHLKQGRVMIDEGHADWEWADEPFDTTAYGIRAEYNYYNLREYLGHFYAVSLNSEPVTAALLDSVDVLVIKTPTEPFRGEEIDAIEDFVTGGGGLLLIGDHTNLFGMTTHLNEIAERFAVRFRCDDTFDIATTGFSDYRKPLVGVHPAAREVKEFAFLTSCSIEGGIRTRPVMLGCGLGSEEADYGHPNFFGNISYDLCDRFGLFLQAAVTACGEGRVMLFSDSTCFSNFCMFCPGRCELALGMIDYLNRRGRRYPLATHLMLASIGVIGAVLCAGALRRGRVRPALRGLASMLPAMLAGMVLGLVAVSHVNGALHGELPWRRVENVILFDTGHTAASFFTYPGAPRRSGVMGFEALYICAQRIGAHPCTGRLEDLDAVSPTGVVVINPSRSFTEDEMAAVDAFLRGGGTLLLLDSVRNDASTANQLLRPYGLAIRTIPDMDAPVVERGAMAGMESGLAGVDRGRSGMVRPIAPRLVIQGGIGLSHDHASRARIAFVQVGTGLLLVATDSFSYSHHVLGSLLELSRPSRTARNVYSEVYALLENLIRRSAEPGNIKATDPDDVRSAGPGNACPMHPDNRRGSEDLKS